jgi:hypothetical protein
MSFRTLIKSAACRVARAAGFTAQAPAPAPAPVESLAILQNQEALCASIAAEPRCLSRYEAQALLLMACRGDRYRQQARAALWIAAKANGRHVGPAPTMEPRLCKASTRRLSYWATDTGTPV